MVDEKKAPAQFLLFGGEEPAISPSHCVAEPKRPAGDASFEYPADAFPPDPLKAFISQAASEFSDAAGDARALRLALCRWLKRGAALASHEELIDLLGISSDVLDQAGFSDDEALNVMRMLGTLSDREIEDAPV